MNASQSPSRPFSRSTALLVVLLIISMLALSACGNTATTAPTTVSGSEAGTAASTETTAPIPEPDQSKQMVFAGSRNQAPGEKDGHYCTLRLGVWEPLVTQDDSGHPAPALAEAWSSNADATEWTFKLKQGVVFSNNVPFDADAVVKNFERYQKGPFPSSFYGINIERTYPGFQSAEAVDAHTVKLSFSAPQPMLPYSMVNFGSSMFEPSCFAEDGNFKEMAIGTGPYKMSENVLEEYCSIVRNPLYAGEPPILDTIKFRVIPDANTRYSALLAGEVDGLCDLGAITPSLAAEIEGNPDFKVSVGNSGISHFLNVNGNRFPFNDVRMREGLSLLLDRQEIIDAFYNGYGVPAGSFLSFMSPFHKDIPVKHDPERGKALIKEVIGDKKVSLDFILPNVDANRYPYEEEAQYIQALLADVGIEASITVLQWGTCKEKMTAGDYDMCLKIQGLPGADPLSLFKGFMHSAGSTNKTYGLGYHNDAMDALIDTAETTIDLTKRAEIYREIQDIAATDFPNIPLFYSQEIVASNAKVDNYVARPYGLKGYTDVKWNQ